MKISFNLNSPCLEEVMCIKQSNQPGHKLHTISEINDWHEEIRFLELFKNRFHVACFAAAVSEQRK